MRFSNPEILAVRDEAIRMFEARVAWLIEEYDDPDWAAFAERNKRKIIAKLEARIISERKADLAKRRKAAPAITRAPVEYTPKPEPLTVALGNLEFQGAQTPMFAATGATYDVAYAPVLTASDGMGPILASNLMSSREPMRPVGASTPGYPKELQARSLQTPAEQTKIGLIAESLDPARLLAPHSDPTLGPPVVWPMRNSLFPVVAGNSRVVAILAASPAHYENYENAIAVWAQERGYDNFYPAPKGERWIMVRVLLAINGKSPVSFQDAVKLGGASQESTAGEESTIGKALSLLRTLGITSVADLPQLTGWTEAVHADNIREFVEENRQFWSEIIGRVDPVARATYEADPEKGAQLAAAVFTGFLPASVRKSGFGDRKTEQALIAALPGMVTIAQLVSEGRIKPGWNLLPELGKAVDIYRVLKSKGVSVEKSVRLLEQEDAQVRMADTSSALSEALKAPLAFSLAMMLYKAAGRTSPELSAGEFLTAYFATAIADDPSQRSLLSAAFSPDPAAILAGIIGMRMPVLRRGNPLTVLLPPSAHPAIGHESGKAKRQGIGKHVSPHGSTRYLMYQDGEVVAGLQVMSQDGTHAKIANVHTRQDHRRKGYADKLLARAERDFSTVAHADTPHLSDDAKGWIRRGNPKRNGLFGAHQLQGINEGELMRELRWAQRELEKMGDLNVRDEAQYGRGSMRWRQSRQLVDEQRFMVDRLKAKIDDERTERKRTTKRQTSLF